MRRIAFGVLALGLVGGAVLWWPAEQPALGQIGPETFEGRIGDTLIFAGYVSGSGSGQQNEQWIVRNDVAFPLALTEPVTFVQASEQFTSPAAFQAHYRNALQNDPDTPLNPSDDDPVLYLSTFTYATQSW